MRLSALKAAARSGISHKNRTENTMDQDTYSAIWESTLGQTLSIAEGGSTISNGLSADTSSRYEKAAHLSDEEMWKLVEAGEL
jgi:hypothetical protein